MYLYPVVNTGLPAAQNGGKKDLINMCVPDCSSVNMFMVNNPQLGRCEFLGFYCMVGNYKEGCKRTYLEGCKFNVLQSTTLENVFQLVPRPAIGFNDTYPFKTFPDLNQTVDTFMVSDYIDANLTTDATTTSSSVENCLVPNQYSTSYCNQCRKGYVLAPKKGLSTSECVLRCPDG